jgi:hypothetical protein
MNIYRQLGFKPMGDLIIPVYQYSTNQSGSMFRLMAGTTLNFPPLFIVGVQYVVLLFQLKQTLF